MLFSLLQIAMRHKTSRETLLSAGDYKRFHEDLSCGLAQALAGGG